MDKETERHLQMRSHLVSSCGVASQTAQHPLCMDAACLLPRFMSLSLRLGLLPDCVWHTESRAQLVRLGRGMQTACGGVHSGVRAGHGRPGVLWHLRDICTSAPAVAHILSVAASVGTHVQMDASLVAIPTRPVSPKTAVEHNRERGLLVRPCVLCVLLVALLVTLLRSLRDALSLPPVGAATLKLGPGACS